MPGFYCRDYLKAAHSSMYGRSLDPQRPWGRRGSCGRVRVPNRVGAEMALWAVVRKAGLGAGVAESQVGGLD